MKKFLLISTVIALGLGGCAHTKTDAAASSASTASEAKAVCNPGEKCSTGGGLAGPIIEGVTTSGAEATCTPEDEGYPKCSTGGGLAGPIIEGITTPAAEATCTPEDEGYPKCSTGGGVAGPIIGG